MPSQRGNLTLIAVGGQAGALTAPGGVGGSGVFRSDEQTGTGSAQDVAHDLGAVPSLVWFVPTELPAGLASGADVAEGTHTDTNLVVTVTSGLKFRAYALK